MNSIKDTRICVIGLGYVGLPLARLFSTKYPTIGYDMNRQRVDALMAGHDATLEVSDELLQEAIDKNGFLHSGDLGIKDKDGYYRITGRIKDMIIRGGENIYPREIEEFLYHLEGVSDVQVAAVPSKKYGEEVCAFIILKEGVTMDTETVREFCKGKIARYKIPKYVFFIKEFPLTGSGKIQKYKLKDLGLKLAAEQGIEII